MSVGRTLEEKKESLSDASLKNGWDHEHGVCDALYQQLYFLFVISLVISYCLETIFFEPYQDYIRYLKLILATFVGYSMSVSFTKFITIRSADLCSDDEVRNSVIFIVSSIINGLLLIF